MKRRAALNETQYIQRPTKRPRTLAASVQQEVKKELRKTTELKYCIRGESAVLLNYSGQYSSLLYNLTRGDGSYNSYDGATLFPKSVKLRMQWNFVDTTNAVRVIILQCIKGTPPTPAELLVAAGSLRAPYSTYDRSYKKRCKILYDNFDVINSAIGPLAKECYIKGKKLAPVELTKNGDTQAVTVGDILIYFYNDSIDQQAQVEGYWTEVTFTD